MKRYLARLGLIGVVALAAALGASGPAHATITVLDQYYLGEADGPGAIDGSVPLITTDSIGSLDLAEQTNTRPSVIATYTSNVSAGATAHTGSNLAIQFSNDNGHNGGTDTLYSAPARATAATDNFGIEGWFKVTVNHNPGIVAFNGSAGFNGFGLMVNQVGFTGTYSYQGLYGGGGGALDSRVPVTLDSWVYMAMVRDGGVTSLYVNNTTPITPSNPFTGLPNPSITPLAASQGFGIGGDVSGNDTFAGAIDEVRVFKFVPGVFSTSDLLISQTPPPPPPPPQIVTLWNTNASGTFSDSPNWDNGVPDASKTPVFRRGASVSYTVTVSDSHQDVSDRLLVGSNRVTFAPGVETFKTYTVENTTTAEDGRGIIIGEVSTDSAVVNTSLPSFSGAAATLGDAPRSRGTLNVTGGTFNVTGSDVSNIEFIIGRKGAGILNVTGGATANVTADSALGEYNGSSGTATVSGAGSTWSNFGYLYVGYGGHAAVNVTSGGRVETGDGINDTRVQIATESGSVGTVNVDGIGSRWDDGGLTFSVGKAGAGALNITGGGQVSNYFGLIGQDGGSSGTVKVNGNGSTWTNFGDLSIGFYGVGVLNITGGGKVSDDSGELGEFAGSAGTVNVDGNGSTWTNNSNVYVGSRGTGVLHITNGSKVSDVTGIVGGVVGAAGIVTVDGTGSTWTNSAGLTVADTVNITGGGHVSAGVGFHGISSFIGTDGPQVTAMVSITGTGSTLTNAGSVVVGAEGTGVLNISAGGQVSDTDGSVGGFSPNGLAGAGTVSVDGAGSKWNSSGDVIVGYKLAGTLNVNRGGQVNDSNAYIGYVAGSAGAVSVSGGTSKWTNSGSLYVGYNGSGSLTVSNSGTVQAPDVIVDALGEIHGNGFITGNVQNGGLFSPGNSPGVLTITGNYTQTTVGKLLIELAGTTPGTQYDQLHVSGTVTLDSMLQVSLISGFAPSSGNSFDLLTATSGITGTFAIQQLPTLAGGLVWNLNYGPNDVILSVGGVLGDYNHNGIVDAADYIVWRKSLGQSGAGLAADGNNNGTIDTGDLDISRAHFGQTAGSGSGATANAAVPEPATFFLCIVGLLAMSSGRRVIVS